MSKPKPHRRRKEARPAEIADAGFKEFAKHGFAGTRLDDVAARAGISKGTIYLYFDSKQSLFEAAVLSRLGSVPDVISSLISLYPGPTKPLLKQVFKQMYKTLAAGDLHVVMRIIIAEGGRFPSIRQFYYREFIAKMQANIAKIVERGIKRGELRKGAATALPMIVVSPGVMATLWQMSFAADDPISLDAFLDAHVDLVFHGISKGK